MSVRTSVTTARPDELVMLWAVSKLKNHVAYGWTGKGLWHSLSPVVVLATAGDYYPCICPVDKFEKLVLNNVLLEQTQGGLALASNSYGYGAYSDDSALLFRRKAPGSSEGFGPGFPSDCGHVFRVNRPFCTGRIGA